MKLKVWSDDKLSFTYFDVDMFSFMRLYIFSRIVFTAIALGILLVIYVLVG
jgi:hypothetical protein